MAPFELLSGFPKSTSGEVVAMEWSPTMDLIAIATSDSQVAVVRTGWQRLFAIPAAQPIHCLAWRPDGQELMVGHADGSVALYNIEDGELLCTSNTHHCALRLVSWGLSPSEPGRALDSPYACSLSDLFPPLPSLPKGSGAQLALDSAPLPLDAPLHRLLFEPGRSLEFDLSVTADDSARVQLRVHGRFSLGFLPLADFPALDFGDEPPALLRASLAPSLHALTLVVATRGSARVSLPDGTRQQHEAGTLLLGFRTGQLSRARQEIEALALSFLRCEALTQRASAALEMARQAWAEAAGPFHAKLARLREEVRTESDLNPSDGPATVPQELLALLAYGAPSARVRDVLAHELREAELTRALKAANAAAGAIAQLVLTQVAPALELVVHLVGNLRGLSRWPHHFAGTLGLQPKKVSALLEAAEALRAAAELLLVCARRTDSGLVALLGWLIHAVRRLRDEAPPSADDVPLPDAITVGEYLGRCSGDELLDEVGDLFSTEEGLAAAAEALPTDPLDEHCTLGPIRRLPALEEELAAALSDCFNPVAQHVSAGFQLHSCTPLHADGSAESSTDADGLHIDLRHPEPSPPPPEPAEPAMPGPPPAACLTKPAQLLISAALGALAEEGGVQLVLLRARWSLQDKGPPSWEACAARTPHAHLCRAHFYRDGKIALLHASDAAAGSRLTVVQHEELPFMPIASLPGGSGAPPPLLGLVLTCSLPVVELDCERSRHFAGAVADRLALAERRDGRWGMCSLVLTQKRRIYFLDLEADEEDEEDEEAIGDEESVGERRSDESSNYEPVRSSAAGLSPSAGNEALSGPTSASEDEDMDMEED